MGDKQKALNTLKTAINIIKNDPQNHYYFAVLQNDLGQRKQAILTIMKALKTYPNNEELLTLAYSIHLNNNEISEAKKIATILVKTYPNNKQYQQISNSN